MGPRNFTDYAEEEVWTWEVGEDCMMRSFITYTLHNISRRMR
jgi:hypothetical protein